MITEMFNILSQLDTFFWGYTGFSLIIVLGMYFTFTTGLFQITGIPTVLRTIHKFITQESSDGRGIHPLKTFFASVGGMLGVGNVVGIVTAIQLGGPGALLWVWIAGFVGSLIKYSEIYLGLKHRVKNDRGGYDGGPMYFLRQAFGVKWISVVVCVLLCIYGVEIYQFNVAVDTLASSWDINKYLLAAILMVLVIYAGVGGVRRVSNVCSWIMPGFILVYVFMCVWVVSVYYAELPALFMMVVKSAFTGHAAVGGFAGSTIMLAIQNGMASACYAADIGIGYDSIIQSESRTVFPERQARIAFFGVCLDNFICTLSILVVLVTGLWQMPLDGEGPPLVQLALSQHFPFINAVMPIFIFVLAYTTLIAYLIVGIKCARYLYPAHGTVIYVLYAIFAFTFFTFYDQTQALLVMRVSGALLLMINLAGIFMLRKEVAFTRDEKAPAADLVPAEGT